MRWNPRHHGDDGSGRGQLSARAEGPVPRPKTPPRGGDRPDRRIASGGGGPGRRSAAACGVARLLVGMLVTMVECSCYSMLVCLSVRALLARVCVRVLFMRLRP